MAAKKKIGVGFAVLAGMALVGVIVENHSKKWYIKGVETVEISRIRSLISDILAYDKKLNERAEKVNRENEELNRKYHELFKDYMELEEEYNELFDYDA